MRLHECDFCGKTNPLGNSGTYPANWGKFSNHNGNFFHCDACKPKEEKGFSKINGNIITEDGDVIKPLQENQVEKLKRLMREYNQLENEKADICEQQKSIIGIVKDHGLDTKQFRQKCKEARTPQFKREEKEILDEVYSVLIDDDGSRARLAITQQMSVIQQAVKLFGKDALENNGNSIRNEVFEQITRQNIELIKAIDANPNGIELAEKVTGVVSGMLSDADLMVKAIEIIAKENKVSTALLQRHLRIGYNRAADLIDKLENYGAVSPADHVGRRTIIELPKLNKVEN